MAIMAALLALSSACSQKAATLGGGAAAHGDKLRLPVTTTFASTDPHYTAQNSDILLNTLLYESFYDVDNKGNTDPRLATSHEVSEDGLRYTYHLKKGVKWQTGGELTSDDVLYSMERAQNSPYTASFLEGVADVSAPDANTVVFTLSTISPAFHTNLNRVPIVGRAATEGLEPGFANAYKGGTGPYSIKEWLPDQRVSVVRSDVYHGVPGNVEEIVFTVFGDTSASLRAFESGELDFTSVLAGDWERIKSAGKYKTQIQDSISVIYVTLNNQKAPFDDLRIRQAVNYAINKEDMLAAAVDGNGRVLHTIGNPEMVFGIPKPGEIFEYSHDLEKAKALLAEAGFPDGLALDAPILAMGSEEFSIPAQVLQSQLADAGITAEIQTMEQSALVTDLITGNYSIGIIGISLDLDASAFSAIYTTPAIDALNLARYSNPLVDERFIKAGQTLDPDERKELYRQAFDQASKDAAYAPLYSMQMTLAMDPDLFADIDKNYYYWKWN
jgi:peptide/nickel transport system substrate-binding protein